MGGRYAIIGDPLRASAIFADRLGVPAAAFAAGGLPPPEVVTALPSKPTQIIRHVAEFPQHDRIRKFADVRIAGTLE